MTVTVGAVTVTVDGAGHPVVTVLVVNVEELEELLEDDVLTKNEYRLWIIGPCHEEGTYEVLVVDELEEDRADIISYMLIRDAPPQISLGLPSHVSVHWDESDGSVGIEPGSMLSPQ